MINCTSKKAIAKEMEKRLMREKRLIDIFQEQQEQNPFAFAYENLNSALQIFLANDRIAPKTVINVYPLANALGLSRTTVIKSLECLRKENWISLDERNRYIAAKPTMETLHDIVIFREMLEPFTVKLATKYATENDLAELGRLLEGFRQIDLTAAPGDDDIRRFVDVEMAFHDRLSKMCRNPYLINAWQINRVRIIQQVWLTYKSFFDRTQSGTHRFSKDHPYQLHHQLYNAICERNEQMAMGSVFTHQRNLDLKIYLPYTME